MRKTTWTHTATAADTLTAASLVYLLVTMDSAALTGVPGLWLGIGVPLFVAHVVARLVAMRRTAGTV